MKIGDLKKSVKLSNIFNFFSFSPKCIAIITPKENRPIPTPSSEIITASDKGI
jgi:hypothetical protein